MANDEKTVLAPLPLSIPYKILYFVLLIFCAYISWFAGCEIYEQYWDSVHEGRAIVPMQMISICVTLVFFSISTLGILYRLITPLSKQIYLGKLVGRFVTMAFAIGFPLMIFIVEPNGMRKLTRDGDARSNLESIYRACKGHWANKGADNACDLYAIRLNGFIQSKNVLVELGEGKEFSAKAWHVRGMNSFIINAQGEIKKDN
ncbi:MAG: hypothetical protein ACQ9MH_11175 [Nitrospinales bacterium]